jgi:hypothetical protein
MWAYVLKVAGYLVRNEELAQDQKIAAEIGVHPSTLSKAKHRSEFREWFADELALLTHDRMVNMIIRGRIAGQAAKGKIDQQRLHADIEGWTDHGKAAGPGGGQTLQVIIAVPQPDYAHATVIDCSKPYDPDALPAPGNGNGDGA